MNEQMIERKRFKRRLSKLYRKEKDRKNERTKNKESMLGYFSLVVREWSDTSALMDRILKLQIVRQGTRYRTR